MRIKALRAQRAQLVADATAILDKAAATPEDNAQFDAIMAQADTMKGQITRLEQAATVEAELATLRDTVAHTGGASVDAQANDSGREKRLFVAWATGNFKNIVDADRAVIAQRSAPDARFTNAASVGTSTAGGYTVAPAFVRELLIAQKAFGGMRGVSRSMPTDTGVDLPWPTMDDTSNVATIVGENTVGAAGADLVVGSKTLKAWTYRSGFLPISIELMQDSAFDFDALIRDSLATRFARGQNAHFTNGNGTTQPQGVTVGATLGTTGVAGQTTSVIYDDLINLQHSIDPAYRAGAVFMMHDSTIKVLRKLKDSVGHPLWEDAEASLSGMGMSGTLLSAPVVVNQDMPVMGAGASSILYGNFSNYVIRDVLGVRITRLNERFAENGQVAFIGFQRTDGRLVSAAQPIKYYANSAT